MPADPDFISTQTLESKRFYLDLSASMHEPLSVVCGGVERVSQDYVVERADFPYFGVEMVADGEGGLVLGGREFRLSRGVVFAYGPGLVHRIENHPPGSMRKYYIDFVGTEAEQLLKAAGLLDGNPLLVGGVIELADLWDSIERETRETSEPVRDICELLLRILLCKIRQRRITSGEKIPKAYQTYERIREYVEHHFLEVATIEAVAAACDVTPVYISKLFRKYASTGAYQFLLRLRMNYAAELLIHQRMKVREVSEKMHFADPFQFSRAFKRVHGVAPTRLINRDVSDS